MAMALIIVALSLPLPAEVIWWLPVALLDTFFLLDAVVPEGAFLIVSKDLTHRALVTPDVLALTEPMTP